MDYISQTRNKIKARQMVRKAIRNMQSAGRYASKADSPEQVKYNLSKIKERIATLLKDDRSKLVSNPQPVIDASNWHTEFGKLIDELETFPDLDEVNKLIDAMNKVYVESDPAFGYYQVDGKLKLASEGFDELTALLKTVPF